MKLSVNGRLFDETAVPASLITQGFLSGEGLFETLRVRGGKIEFAQAHIARLLRSAATLAIPYPWNDEHTMAALRQVTKAAGESDLILRLVAVRGLDESPAIVLIVPEPFIGFDPRPMAQGFRLATCPFPRNERSPLCRHKTLSYLEPMLAHAHARRTGADEALLLNTAGRVAGAAMANLFFMKDGVLTTPPIEEGAFPGIIRAAVLQAAGDLGYASREAPVHPGELAGSAEVFLTSSRFGLAPVSSIDGTPLPDPVKREAAIPHLRMRVRSLAAEEDLPSARES